MLIVDSSISLQSRVSKLRKAPGLSFSANNFCDERVGQTVRSVEPESCNRMLTDYYPTWIITSLACGMCLEMLGHSEKAGEILNNTAGNRVDSNRQQPVSAN